MIAAGAISLIAALLLFIFSVAFAVRVATGQAKGRLMALSQSPRTAAIGDIGISVLCVEPHNADHIATLLDSPYPHSEVVVAIDSALRTDIATLLMERYALIVVDYIPFRKPPTRIKRLYRSRSQTCRRLIMLDMEHADHATMCDTAAGVASFDYLMNISPDAIVRPYAIGRIAIEIGTFDRYSVALVRTMLGSPITVIFSESLAAVGGFRHRSRLRRRRFGRSCRIFEPLASGGVPIRGAICAAVLLLAIVATALVAILAHSPLAGAVAITLTASTSALLFVSEEIISENRILAAFATALDNFIDFLGV